MRVFLTGASGLLGTWLLRTVPSNVEVVAAVHVTPVDWPDVVEADLRELDQARTVLRATAPELVLHAAYAREEEGIVTVTENVAVASREVGASVVMLSTEAVFAGDGRPRSETDRPDPQSEYGRWKAEAEEVTQVHHPLGTVARLPLLVSLDPPDSAVARVLLGAAQNEDVDWYADERRQPAYASEVAAALWRLSGLPHATRRGFWHLPGPERLTRREIGRRIAAALDVPDPGREVAPPENSNRPRDLYLTGARARSLLRWEPERVLARPEPGSTGADGSS